MKFKTLSIALAAALAVPAAFAAISPGTTQSGANAAYNGNGELFLSVFDDTAKVSYTLDLGVTQNTFFTSGQQDAGAKFTWNVNDAAFASFLSVTSAANRQWSVLAFDSTGGTGKADGATGNGGTRMFNTVQAGDEALLPTLTNQLYLTGIGASQAGTFFNAINTTGTHGTPGQPLDFTVNGSSVNADTDSGNAYYGDGSVGLSTTLNGNAPFNMGNAVGTASGFYFLTRSGADQLAGVAVDQFNNSKKSASFLLVANPGLAGASSYTLTYALAPIPEPQTYALMLAGLAIVGAMARRRFNG